MSGSKVPPNCEQPEDENYVINAKIHAWHLLNEDPENDFEKFPEFERFFEADVVYLLCLLEVDEEWEMEIAGYRRDACW